MIVTIGGRDLTDYLDATTVSPMRIEHAIGRTSTCDLSFIATRDALGVSIGDPVTIHHVAREFGGMVETIKTIEMFPSPVNNLVVNPGFEHQLDDWFQAGTGPVATLSEDKFYGEYSVDVFSMNPAYGLYQDLTRIEPSTTYRMSCWAKCPMASGIKLRMHIEQNSSSTYHSIEFDADSNWKFYSTTFSTNAYDVDTQRIAILGPGNAIVDDVSVEPIADVQSGRLSDNSLCRIQVTCVDWSTILNRRLALYQAKNRSVTNIISDLITGTSTANGGNIGDDGFWTTLTSGTVLGIPSPYMPMITEPDEGIESTLSSEYIDSISAVMVPVSDILDDITQKTGIPWWVTADKQIVIRSTALTAPYDIEAAHVPSHVLPEATLTERVGEYRNVQYVSDIQVYTDTRSTGMPGFPQLRLDRYPILTPQITVSDGTYNFDRTCSDDPDDRTVLASGTGGGTTGIWYQGTGSKLQVQCSAYADVGKTVWVYLYNVGHPDVIDIGTATLGSEFAWVYVDDIPTGMNYKIVAMRVSNAAAGNIVFRDENTEDEMGRIPTGSASVGLMFPSALQPDIWVKPSVVLDTFSGYGASDPWVGCKYIDEDGAEQYQFMEISGTAEQFFDNVAQYVEEFYFARTAHPVKIQAAPEFRWYSQDTATADLFRRVILTNTMWANELTSSDMATIEYVGTRYVDPTTSGIIVAEDSGEIATRSGVEDNTGRYENFYEIDTPKSYYDFYEMPDNLLNTYKYFEKELSLSTYSAGYRVGQEVVVNLPKYDIADETMYIREVIMERTMVPEQDGNPKGTYVWRLRLTNSPANRDWTQWYTRKRLIR